MFLSGKWITENGEPIVEPFNPDQVDCSAYTMRVGDEAYVSPDDKNSKASPISQLNHQEPISIPSGQFAFLITLEFVRLPENLFGLINMKSGLKIQGLVNVSGFHVDPGYHGRLVFAVYNAGPKTVHLRQNDDAFLIWFARLENSSSNYARKKPGYMNISSDLISKVPSESTSLNSLRSRIDKIEAMHRFIVNGSIFLVGAVVSGLIAAYFAGWFAKSAYFAGWFTK